MRLSRPYGARRLPATNTDAGENLRPLVEFLDIAEKSGNFL